jgi:hypothetical protein
MIKLSTTSLSAVLVLFQYILCNDIMSVENVLYLLILSEFFFVAFSIPPNTFLDSNLIRPRPLFSESFPIHHPSSYHPTLYSVHTESVAT